MAHARLWARVYNTPLLIHPDKAKVIEAVFRAHIGGDRKARLMEDDGPSPEQIAADRHEQRCRAYTGLEIQRRDDKPYALTASGIALIPVLGTLVQRGSWLDSMSGLTSYDMVASMVERAMNDQDVRAAVLEVDSPGGEAAGLMDVANRLFSARGKKPVWSHANEQAYSAAYWLATAAGRTYVAQTGGVGSIGAVMLHVDQSKRDAMMGYAYTFIYSGAHKVDGNSHQPINKASLKWAQTEVDRMRDMFAQAVSKHRNVSADAALGTEARLLTPAEAQDGGYVDGVMGLVEAVRLLESELKQGNAGAPAAGRTSKTTEKENDMKLSAAAAAVLAAMNVNAETVEAARGEALETSVGKIASDARAEGKAEAEKTLEAKAKEARAEGVTAERTRTAAILNSEEAKERGSLALHLALQTDTDVEAAKKLLAASPKQTGGSFAAAMAGLANPKVGVDASRVETEQPKIDTQAIYASRQQARAAGTK